MNLVPVFMRGEPFAAPRTFHADPTCGHHFFREPRTPREVHDKLLETYHCLPNRVQMALLRLHRKRELRKTVKQIGDQEHTAYAW